MQGARAGCCASGPLKGHRKRLSSLLPSPLFAHACGRHADCAIACGEETPRGTEPQGAPPSGACHLTQAQSLSQNGKHRKGSIKPKRLQRASSRGPFKRRGPGGPGPPRRSELRCRGQRGLWQNLHKLFKQKLTSRKQRLGHNVRGYDPTKFDGLDPATQGGGGRPPSPPARPRG